MNGNKPSVLITGGLGNLGAWITDHLLRSEKYEITIVSNTNKGSGFENRCRVLTADVSNYNNLSQSLGDQQFDFVIHLASVNDTFIEGYPEKALAVNALGTRNLLECLKKKQPRKLIYFSTFHVYGKNRGSISELDAPQPVNDYALTHLFAEQYIEVYHRNSGLPFIIFRLSNSYGCPKEVSHTKWYLLFNDLCRSAFETQKIILHTNGNALRDFIYMGDVCDIVENALHHSVVNEIINLGSGISYSIKQIAGYVQKAYLGFSGTLAPVIINDNDRNIYANDLKYSVDKLKFYFGEHTTQAFLSEAQKIFELLKKGVCHPRNA